MARGQFLGQWTPTLALFVVAMVNQFNSSSPENLTFDRSDVDALVGSPFALTCTLNPDYATRVKVNSTNLVILLEYIGHDDYIPINKDFIRIVNAHSIQLNYTQIPAEFVDKLHFITCKFLDKHLKTTVSMKLLVKERHQRQPRVTQLRVDNWDELNIGWEPAEETDSHFKVNYELWYRNDSSTTAFTRAQNCADKWCTIVDPLKRTYPGEMLIVKVNGSVNTSFSRGILETVTSKEVRVNLTDYLRPRKIDQINVIQNQSIKTLVFKPPKTNRNSSYDINVNCTKPPFTQSKNITRLVRDFNNATHSDRNSKKISVTVPLVGLPTYSNCTVSVRAISVKGGNWSEWAHHDFQSLQDVPLAAPRSCKGCFQVKETGVDPLFDVIVYFTPLSEEEARGRVELYRIKMIEKGDRDNVTKELSPDPLPSFLLSNLSNESDYKISIEAKTKSGYNETLDLSSSTILVPQSKHRPKSLPHKFIVVALNETAIRTTWKMEERNDIDKMFLFWCKGSLENDRPCLDALKWKEFPFAFTGIAISITYVTVLDKDESYDDFIFGTGIERNGKSSGIMWNSCTYDIRSSPPKPRIETYHSSSSGISISLLEPSCENNGNERGFIIGYRLFLCPIQSSDSTNDRRCLEEMRSLDFYGQNRFLNLNDLRTNQTYLVLVQSLSESRTSENVTLEVTTFHVDNSFLLTMIAIIVGVFVVSIIAVLIVRLKQMSFWRYFKGVPVIVPPAVTQAKPLPQLMYDAGYRHHLFGTVDSFESSTPFDSSSSVETLSLPQSPAFLVLPPKAGFWQRSDSGIEVTTPLESILPPLTGMAPSGGLQEHAFLHERVNTEDGSYWNGSSEWRSTEKPSCPVLSVLPLLTGNDYSLDASYVVSDCSGGYGPQYLDGSSPQWLDGSRPQYLDGSRPQCLDGSRPQCLDGSGPQCLDGSGYAWCEQHDTIVILPVPSGQAQPVTLNSSTSYSNSSDTEERLSCSSTSSDGLVVYHLNSIICSESQLTPVSPEELVRNEGGFQPENNDSTRNDDDQARNVLPFSDYSSVTFDKSS